MHRQRKECSVGGCTRPARTRGLCAKHYMQQWHKEHPKERKVTEIDLKMRIQEQDQTLRAQETEIKRLQELLTDVFNHPFYLTDTYYRAEGRRLENRYQAALRRKPPLGAKTNP